MKCLIIAAGRGSRLRNLSDSKPLLPILGVPLLERVIRGASLAGAKDFCVVTGYKGELVRERLPRLAERLGIDITDAVNDEWEKGNGLSVLRARDWAGGDEFFLLMADHLFDPAILSRMAEDPPEPGTVILAVDRNLRNPLVDLEDVTKVYCEDGSVRSIGKDLKDYNGFDTGIFLCTPALFDAIEKSAEQGDTSLSGGIRYLAGEGRVRAFDTGGRFWIDVDDERAVEKAEDALIERLKGKASDGPVSRLINRPLSTRLTRRLARTSVTPNQISLFSFLLSILAAWIFSHSGYLSLFFGALIAQAASIIDGSDGEVARLRFLESGFGAWFDAVLDRYADAFLLFGLTWHSFSQSARALDLFVGFMAVIGSFVLSYTADKYDSLMRERFERGRSLRIGRDVRVFIIFIGAILNLPYHTLLLTALIMNLETIRRVIVCYRAE